VYFAEQHHGTVRQLRLSNASTTTFVGTQLCDGAGTPQDGTGAHTGASCPSIGSIATVPIFNQAAGGAFTYHFPTRAIYYVDQDTLRRID
jgi:hypothetical protein